MLSQFKFDKTKTISCKLNYCWWKMCEDVYKLNIYIFIFWNIFQWSDPWELLHCLLSSDRFHDTTDYSSRRERWFLSKLPSLSFKIPYPNLYIIPDYNLDMITEASGLFHNISVWGTPYWLSNPERAQQFIISKSVWKWISVLEIQFWITRAKANLTTLQKSIQEIFLEILGWGGGWNLKFSGGNKALKLHKNAV